MIRYTRSPWDTVGYQFKADFFCPVCVVEEYLNDDEQAGQYLRRGFYDVDNILDHLARAAKVDRADEESFDSDDFPKVILRDQLEDDEFCGRCGRAIDN